MDGKQPAVYITTNRRHGTLYVGVTANLIRRVAEHRSGALPGFTRRYGLHRLVHVEMYLDIPTAIEREKRLKRWKRDWKIALIESGNPEWRDLWPEIIG